jgi:hypothetical protein
MTNTVLDLIDRAIVATNDPKLADDFTRLYLALGAEKEKHLALKARMAESEKEQEKFVTERDAERHKIEAERRLLETDRKALKQDREALETERAALNDERINFKAKVKDVIAQVTA